MMLVLAVLRDVDDGRQLLERLETARTEGRVELEDLALVHRHGDGTTRVERPGEVGLKGSAVRGGAVGLLVGLVISPAALPVAAVGAATGAIVAKLRRSGLGDDVAASLSRRLDAGEVLVCALGEDPEIETLARQARLRGFENVVVPATTRDVLEELSGLPDDLAF